MRAVARKLRQQTGAIYIWVMWSIIPLLGFSAFAVDVGFMAVVKTQLQIASDSAASAALSELQAGGTQLDARSEAVNLAAQHKVLGAGPIVRPQDVVFGDYNHSSRNFRTNGFIFAPAVQVTARRALDLLLAPALGVTAADVETVSVAASGCREFVLMLDVTASWAFDFALAQQALLSTIAAIDATSRPGDQVGLVAFAADVVRVLPLRPVQAARNQLDIAINNMQACPDYGPTTTVLGMLPGGCQGTDHALGIRDAIDVIGQSNSQCGAERAIVILSDGPSCNILGPGGTNADAEAAADEADAAGISIVPILFARPIVSPQDCAVNPPADATFNNNLARGFGRPAISAVAFDLPAMLSAAATRLPARLVE